MLIKEKLLTLTFLFAEMLACFGQETSELSELKKQLANLDDAFGAIYYGGDLPEIFDSLPLYPREKVQTIKEKKTFNTTFWNREYVVAQCFTDYDLDPHEKRIDYCEKESNSPSDADIYAEYVKESAVHVKAILDESLHPEKETPEPCRERHIRRFFAPVGDFLANADYYETYHCSERAIHDSWCCSYNIKNQKIMELGDLFRENFEPELLKILQKHNPAPYHYESFPKTLLNRDGAGGGFLVLPAGILFLHSPEPLCYVVPRGHGTLFFIPYKDLNHLLRPEIKKALAL